MDFEVIYRRFPLTSGLKNWGLKESASQMRFLKILNYKITDFVKQINESLLQIPKIFSAPSAPTSNWLEASSTRKNIIFERFSTLGIRKSVSLAIYTK